MMIDFEGKEYKLYFGFGFLSTIASFYKEETQALGTTNSLTPFIVGLLEGDAFGLLNGYMAAMSESDRKLSKKDLERYVMEESKKRENGVQDLIDELMLEVKKQPLLKAKVNELLKRVEQVEKEQEARAKLQAKKQ